jgi:glycosyltransferase involved in cell wall biosynthesis
MTKISVVLGTYNRYKFLKLAISSIREELKKLDLQSEIIVIDGGSTDKTISWLTKQKDIISIIQHNRGTWLNKKIKERSWGYFMNLGFKCAKGKYICMLSDDCLIVPNAIVNGYKLFEEKLHKNETVGAIAFYWHEWANDGNVYHVGLTSGNNLFVNHGMFLKNALKEINYIDENTYDFYFADSDLCLRLLQNGYSIIPSSNSYIEHYPHANLSIRKINSEKVTNDREAFKKRWNSQSISKNKKFKDEFKIFVDTTNTGKAFRKIELTSPTILAMKIKNFIRPLLKRAKR